MLVVDSQQHVELANPVARRIFGVVPIEAEDGTPLVWQPPDPLRQPLADVLQNRREYLPEGFDKAIVLPMGEETHSFLPRILPIRDSDGATIGAAVLLEDITRFRLLDEVKSNLVATVSHELKTPLTSIRLVLHLLLEETVGPLTPKQLELLVDARDNAERLLVMINNLLDLARLEQGTESTPSATGTAAGPAAVGGRVLSAAGRGSRHRACDGRGRRSAAGGRRCGPIPTCLAESARQRPGPHAPRRTDYAFRRARPTARVVFSVADTGCGIPAQYLPMVFERYFRVPGDTSEGGSGLGLAIVREIVTAHGGTVECESQPGETTVFRMSLPVWTR